MDDSKDLDALEVMIDKLYARIVQDDERLSRLQKSIITTSDFCKKAQAMVGTWPIPKTTEDVREVFEEMPKKDQETAEMLEGKQLPNSIHHVQLLAPELSEEIVCSLSEFKVVKVARELTAEMPEREREKSTMESPLKVDEVAIGVFDELPKREVLVASPNNYDPTAHLMPYDSKMSLEAVAAEFATVRHQLEVFEDRLEEMVHLHLLILCRIDTQIILCLTSGSCSVIQACSSLEFVWIGLVVLGFMIKTGFWWEVMFVGNAWIDMSAKNGDLASAHKVFDGMLAWKLVAWTMMITRYAQLGCGKKVIELFVDICLDGHELDWFSKSSVQQLHSLAIPIGLALDVCVGCSLVNIFVKRVFGGLMDVSRRVFEGMLALNVMSRIVLMISKGEITVNHFPNHSILKACVNIHEANIGTQDSDYFGATALIEMLMMGKGQQLHAQVLKYGFESDLSINNALELMLMELTKIRLHGFSAREISIVHALMMSKIDSAERDPMQSTRDFQTNKLINPLHTCRCIYTCEMRWILAAHIKAFWSNINIVPHKRIASLGNELRGAKVLINRWPYVWIGNQLISSEGPLTVYLLLPFNDGACIEGSSSEDIVGLILLSGGICASTYLGRQTPISQAISDLHGNLINSLTPRAHKSLLIGHHERLQSNMKSIHPTSISYGAYITALSQLFYFAIAQAMRDSQVVLVDDSAYASELVAWFTMQVEVFARLVKKHVFNFCATDGPPKLSKHPHYFHSMVRDLLEDVQILLQCVSPLLWSPIVLFFLHRSSLTSMQNNIAVSISANGP